MVEKREENVGHRFHFLVLHHPEDEETRPRKVIGNERCDRGDAVFVMAAVDPDYFAIAVDPLQAAAPTRRREAAFDRLRGDPGQIVAQLLSGTNSKCCVTSLKFALQRGVVLFPNHDESIVELFSATA